MASVNLGLYQAGHSYNCTANIYNGITIWYYEELLRLHIVVKVRSTRQSMPERIYNPITAMGFSAMFTFQLDNAKR